jgi:hypothetical protein
MCNLKHTNKKKTLDDFLRRLLGDMGGIEIAMAGDGGPLLAEGRVLQDQQLRLLLQEHQVHYRRVQRLVVELFLGFHSLQIQKLYFQIFFFRKVDSIITLSTSIPLGISILGVSTSVSLINVLENEQRFNFRTLEIRQYIKAYGSIAISSISSTVLGRFSFYSRNSRSSGGSCARRTTISWVRTSTVHIAVGTWATRTSLWARSSPIPVVVSTLLRSTLRAYIV